MRYKWDFYTVRRWSLYIGGFAGFIIVGSANLIYGREVNPAVYVLLAGMLGLPDVLFRHEQLKTLQDLSMKDPEEAKKKSEKPQKPEEKKEEL